ncbi:MAG: insulinase family protein [Bacteroides sp.]|nr:insulinase family protein [Bacteroides sp.]MCM1413374.1 insulinase family protein [Bacteroides sp.]MCM1471940.1 insulinase family protein [Bacteroides sp.]
MKKFISSLALLLVALIVLPGIATAQMQVPPMGTDPDVRIGKLSNGLTYYIRHNEYPKGQADFYIAQRVGSVLEEENQRGLAHFLEHMCFNGTTHFPGKNLINWLETIGVKFGANLNAYTGVDQTVYNISNVPVAREGVQDSCLLILHDWANDLLLLPEEIDAERGVIHEEWRRSNVGQMRVLEQLLPSIYPGERYGVRLPIGTMEVVDNFAPQALRDYYEKWYRPDLQGIIVVGDIDVDRIEGKIKEMFADIEMPADPAERIYFPVADTQGTIYAIGHEKEIKSNLAELMIKSESLPRELRNTMAYYIQDYVNDMISGMLDARLEEISSKPGSPFAGAGVSVGNFFLANTKDALNVSALAATTDQLPTALAAAYRELLRAVRGGFTVTEFERTRDELLSRAERSYNERNTRQNEVYVNNYVENFLNNSPIPAKEEEYETIKMISGMVTLDMINAALKSYVTDDNRVLLALMPDNEAGVYPTEQQFADALKAVEAEELEPYKEELKAEPLVASLRAPGTIKKETVDKQWDATVWTLSNGATVIVKPTTFKQDEIIFAAYSRKGTANYGADYANSLTYMGYALQDAGLGTYTKSDVSKYLSGKQCIVRPGFNLYTTNLRGLSTMKDLPTLMELIYMNMTDITITPEEFTASKDNNLATIHNQESDPQYIWIGKVIESLYNTPRIQQLTENVVKSADRGQILEVVKAMTDNAADFTFVFIGNVDLETLRPLVEKYIASLPGNAKTAVKSIAKPDPQYEMIGGDMTNTFTAPMQTPQTWVYLTVFGNEPYSMKNAQLTSVAGQIISKRLLDKIREEMGAVYSIGAQASMDRIGAQNTEILSAFPMKPEMKAEALAAIRAIIEDMAVNVDKAELDKVKEYMVKNYTENLELNNGWMSAIAGWLENGVDTFHGNIDSINSITTDDVKAFMANLLAQGNYRVVVLDPAE